MEDWDGISKRDAFRYFLDGTAPPAPLNLAWYRRVWRYLLTLACR